MIFLKNTSPPVHKLYIYIIVEYVKMILLKFAEPIIGMKISYNL